MANIIKNSSRKSYGQVLQNAYNDIDATLSTSGFLTGKIGNSIQRTDTAGGDLDGAAAGDDFSYYDGEDFLYTIRVLYDDAGKTIFHSATRVA